MFFFPYNAMFAGAPLQKKHSAIYLLKVNGCIVPITHHFYWKKDMLEQASVHYARYQMDGKRVYLNDFIQQKDWSVAVKENLNKKLTPGIVSFHKWVGWYLTKAGYRVQEGDTVSLCKWKPEIQDDEIIFSEMQVIEQLKWKK